MQYRKLLTLLIAPLFVVGMTACDVEQTEEGQLPEIEVEEEGDLPAYDIETGDVEVGEDTVTVPDIEIEEDTATVPSVEMEEPEAGGGMDEGDAGEGGR